MCSGCYKRKLTTLTTIPISLLNEVFAEITDRFILRVHPNLEFHAECLKVSLRINLSVHTAKV